jgi:light-regulated signal transduction histidine kinase (bacteriophytochrome)
LRTPLRNIISFSGLLDRKLKENPDKDTKEYLGFIKDYAHHMNNIIHDILDFSKIGKSDKDDTALVNLNEVTNSVLTSLKDKIQERNAFVLIEGVLPTIMADKTHIVQLMQNILENALTYNESEQPEIKIGTQNDENGVPTIYVQDNGIGVDDHYQAKVFEMFTRLHNIEKYPGTGLGLAICKKIVMQYGGRIWLNSTLGKGTTVHLAFAAA